MKKISVIALSLLFCLGGCGAKLPSYKATDARYDVMGLNKIAVGMWVTPTDAYRNEETFRLIADSGINVVNGFGYHENTDEEVQTVLDLCQKTGMKYLYSDLSLEESVKAYAEDGKQERIDEALTKINKFASHPAYGGQMWLDEPATGYFAPLQAFISAYKKKYPDKLAYVNMLPQYATGGNGGSTYDDYVNNWLAYKPEFYSYDSYPLIDYDASETGYRAEMEDYYYNLDMLRVKTLEAKVPMWAFAATLGYTMPDTSSEPNRRVPAREEIRWQVFSDLAFGAKGIQYFCCFTPSQDSYGEAMLTRGGVPTERYGFVKEVNAEFAAYGDILLHSDAVGVMFEDNRRNGFDIYSAPKKSFGSIESIEGNRYVAGCFVGQKNGNKCVLISPTTPRDDIDLTLTMKKGVKSVKAYVGGKQTTLPVQNGKLKLHIDRGDAVLLQL